MTKQTIILTALGSALIFSGGSAAFFHHRASEYAQRWHTAMNQLSVALNASPAGAQVNFPSHTKLTPDPSLEAEILRLLNELEEKNELITKLQSESTPPSQERTVPTAQDREAQLAELQKTDPEKYDEIMTRRENMRDRMQTGFAERAALLLERASNRTSEEEQAQQDYMLQTLNDTWTLTEQMTHPDTSPENRKELRQQISQNVAELKPLLTDERERQLHELGMASGYSDQEADAFVDYILDSFKATSIPFGKGGRGGQRANGGNFQ